MPKALDKQKQELLQTFWEKGMTSTNETCLELIGQACEATGLSSVQLKIDQLSDLGYPSMWLGLINGRPERFFAPALTELAHDDKFVNYSVSCLVKSSAKRQLDNLPEESTKGGKSSKKKRTKTNTGTEASTCTPSNGKTSLTVDGEASNTRTSGKGESSPSTVSDGDATNTGTSGDGENSISTECLYELKDRNSELVARGLKTQKKVVHGRKLKAGWASFLVKWANDHARPWKEFPTHSDEVEVGSFIAWPISRAHLSQAPATCPPRQPVKRRKEVLALVDSIHPMFGRGDICEGPRETRASRK